MSSAVLATDIRNKEELKKNASRRLRNAGYIPAVVYGLNQEPIKVKVKEKDFKDVTKGRSLANLILNLHIRMDGKEKKETTLVKEIQKDPITAELLHIDFIRIQMKKEVEAVVPIHILNEEESIGVKQDGGVIQHGLRELHIMCLPADIPEYIEYDIKDLHMGHNVKVADLNLGDNIKILNNPEEVVVSIIHPTHMVVEQPTEVEEEEESSKEPELVEKPKHSAKGEKEE